MSQCCVVLGLLNDNISCFFVVLSILSSYYSLVVLWYSLLYSSSLSIKICCCCHHQFFKRDVTVKRGAANALLRSQLICNNINVVAMPGGYKDPRVAPYLKGVKHVEPIQRKHNADALPPGWAVAAHSQTLYRTGAKPPRVYYINEEGGNSSWSCLEILEKILKNTS